MAASTESSRPLDSARWARARPRHAVLNMRALWGVSRRVTRSSSSLRGMLILPGDLDVVKEPEQQRVLDREVQDVPIVPARRTVDPHPPALELEAACDEAHGVTASGWPHSQSSETIAKKAKPT